MTQTTATLAAHNLKKSYKSRTVVEDVSFSVRSGEVVGRTCRDDAQQQVEVLLLHPIDHVIDRAVAARHDHQIDRFVSIERVAAEIDRAVYDRVAGLPEHFADGLGIFFDFSFSRRGVIEK